MKIFIIGLPNSGRTTVAKALAKNEGTYYIDAVSWMKQSFRQQEPGEPDQKFQDEYFHFYTERLKANPNLYIDFINNYMESFFHNENFVIDGLTSPKDVIKLFNYNEDYMVFLNRVDNDTEYKDHENIGVSVIRDYCYWMASADLLSKERWLEFNFKIPGEDSDFVKVLGSKNTVMIVKSTNKVIEILNKKIYEIS